MNKSKSCPYPFQFEDFVTFDTESSSGGGQDIRVSLPNVRGRVPSIQASRLRTMMLEAHRDPTKILAHACSMDGLTSRLVEEAGFPMVFLAGYPCASSYGYVRLQSSSKAGSNPYPDFQTLAILPCRRCAIRSKKLSDK